MEKNKLIKFLEYLWKNHENIKKRSHESQKEKFGEKISESLRELCFRRGYIHTEKFGSKRNPKYSTKLEAAGIEFIESTKREELKTKAQISATRWQAGYSIAFIALTLFTIWTAYYFNTHPQPYQPDIHLSTNYQNNEVSFSKDFRNVDFLLYIYNQGNGACIDTKLEYTNFFSPSLRPQKTFRKYTDIKDEVRDEFNSSSFLSFDNTWTIGILEENEVIVVDMTRRHEKLQLPSEFKISVSCNNGKKETLLIKNKNPFIVENPLP